MDQWLYNSLGEPVAYITINDHVFHRSGAFIGRLEDGKLFDKHARYVGEIVQGDRLLRNKGHFNPPRAVPMLAFESTPPEFPFDRPPKPLPPSFVDLEFDELGYVIL
jgi:hypothetical protein